MLAAAIILVFSIWFAWRLSNSSHVRRIEREIRARGEPLTLAELAKTYSAIEERENAAIPLLAAWEKEQPAYWRAIRMGERPTVPLKPSVFDPSLPFLGRNARSISRRSLSTSNLLAAERFIEEQSKHMEAVRAAIQRPRSRFPINIQDGYFALLPHLAQIRTEAQKFQIEALVRSEKGQIREAFEAIQCIKGLADKLCDEPILIGQLVRLRCANVALDALEQLMSRRQLPAEEIDRIVALLEEMRVTNALRRSFLGERVVSLSVFEMSSYQISELISERHESADEIRDRAKGTQLMGWLFRITGVETADRRLILETLTRGIELAELDSLEGLRRFSELEKQLNAKLQTFPPKLYSKMLLPAVDNVAIRFASFESRRRAAILACLAEKYRLTHEGKVPQSVVDLISTNVGAIVRDPFTGELLRLKHLDGVFVIYSVGPDRTDDQGRERQQNEQSGYDITFILER